MRPPTRMPILVVGFEERTADAAVRELRRCGHIAIWLDSCVGALEMLGVVDFALVVIVVERNGDWDWCRRIVTATRTPVAVLTPLLARDRRYRLKAFTVGVVAYVCLPCTSGRVRKLLERLRAGDRHFALTTGSLYRDSANTGYPST